MGMTKRTNANAQIATQYQGPQSATVAIKALKSFKGPKFDQAVEVSGFKVPMLRVREVNTSVDIQSGHTFVLAGLIQHRNAPKTRDFNVPADVSIAKQPSQMSCVFTILRV